MGEEGSGLGEDVDAVGRHEGDRVLARRLMEKVSTLMRSVDREGMNEGDVGQDVVQDAAGRDEGKADAEALALAQEGPRTQPNPHEGEEQIEEEEEEKGE